MYLSLQISEHPYEHKPTGLYDKVVYKRCDITPKELFDIATSGYIFRCNLKSTDAKGSRIFVSSQFLCYDYDHHNETMEETIESLPIKPTFAYHSPTKTNDDGTHRFRIVYVLEQPITDELVWVVTSKHVARLIGFTPNEDMDKCSFVATNLWNGSVHGGVWLGDILQNPQVEIDPCESILKHSVDKLSNGERKTLKMADSCLKTTSIYKDWFSYTDYFDILDKYKDIYAIYDESLPISECDTHYTYDKDTYVTLYRKHERKDGKWSDAKWQDGERRHEKIYADVKILMEIKPDISIEEVIYNMINEIYLYFDFTDLPKTKILINIFTAYTDGKPCVYSGNRRSVRMKRGHNYSKVMSDLKKQACLELFDCNLSLDDNVSMMEYYGVYVSRQTLSKYIKQEGLKLKQPNKKHKKCKKSKPSKNSKGLVK